MSNIYLGIDYGKERVGMAVSDPEGRIALARETIESSSIKEILARVKEIIKEEKVSRIIIGLPLTLEGKEGIQAQETRQFGELLEENLSLPVEYMDERFTTTEGRKEADLKGQKHADAEAARLILETWLRSKRSA